MPGTEGNSRSEKLGLLPARWEGDIIAGQQRGQGLFGFCDPRGILPRRNTHNNCGGSHAEAAGAGTISDRLYASLTKRHIERYGTATDPAALGDRRIRARRSEE